MNTNNPMIVVNVVCGLATHARLALYPMTLFIQYGNVEGEDFIPDGTNEVLPLHIYPELRDLAKDGCWDLEEVMMLFDGESDERLEMCEHSKLMVKAYQAGVTAAVFGLL